MALFDFFKKKKGKENAPVPQESSAGEPAPATVSVPKKEDEAKAAAEKQLKQLIHACHQDNATEHLAAVLEFLRQDVSVWVPAQVSVSPEDEAQFKSAKAGQQITTQDNIRMRIDILKNSEDKRFFPGFSSIQEAPEQYRKQFSWISMSFKGCVESVMKSPDIHAIVLNAFSENLVLTKDLLELIFPQTVQDRTLEKGTVVLLEPVGPEADEMKRIALEFLEKNECSRAYLVKMHSKGEQSYLFAIEQSLFPNQQYFSMLHSKISHAQPNLPVDYVPYDSFHRQLLEQNCRMCWLGNSASTAEIPLGSKKNIRITLFHDSDDQIGKYRVEFLDTCTRYEAFADEMWKLEKVLSFPDVKSPVLAAIHDALMALPEESQDTFEALFARWLEKAHVHCKKGTIQALAEGKVTVLSGSAEGKSITIAHGREAALGRDAAKCELVLTPGYPSVSRLHCRVRFDGLENLFYVTDLSSQGTRICHSESQSTPLEPQKETPVQPDTVLKLADCYVHLALE